MLAQVNQEENDWLTQVFSTADLEQMTPKEIEYWLSLMHNPKNLNTISLSKLQILFSLTYDEVKAFDTYQKEYGKWVSTSELKRIPSWDNRTIQLVKNCTYVSQNDENGKNFREELVAPDIHYSLMNFGMKFPFSKGFSNDTYKGVPFHFQNKITWSKKNNYSIGLALQHDAGEIWDWQPNQGSFGIDYYSAHLSVSNRGVFEKVILGDYQMIGGQGLVFGGGYFLGKGGDPILNITRALSEGRPYNSVTESGFMRGGLVTIKPLSSFKFTLFGSVNKLDAVAMDSTRIISNGLHRSNTEIANKKNLTLYSFGGRLEYYKKNYLLGINHIQNKYSRYISPQVRQDSLSIFKGNFVSNTSLDLSFNWKNFSFFSELAYSSFGGYAFVFSSYLSLSKHFDLVFSGRNYAHNYISIYGNGLSEGTNTTNEEGFYLGFKWKKNKKLLIEGYADLFSSLYPSYLNDTGINGVELFGKFQTRLSSTVNVYCRVRYKEKERYYTVDLLSKSLLGIESNFKFVLGSVLQHDRKFYFHPSIRVHYYQGLQESIGYLFAQDFGCNFSRKLKLDSRIALFNTDDYSSRLYSYEKNIQYAFSFPAYYGEGWKTFLMLKYQLSSKIKLIGRWARTFYFDREVIGSGQDEIPSHIKQEFFLQMKLKL